MKTKFIKKQWWIGGTVVFILTAVFFVTQAINAPKNLGSQVEYIGQKNFGCAWWQGVLTLGFCGDRDVNHSYFYATNLSEYQLKSYFKNAKVELKPIYGINPPYPQTSIEFRFRIGQDYATAMYYPDAQSYISDNASNLKTDKQHIFEVNKTSYELIKKSY